MAPLVKSRLCRDLVLGLYEEVAELATSATRFKAHILNAAPVEKVNVQDAVADVLKYTIAIAQLHGITAEEMAEAFMQKSDVVEHKAQGERFQLEENTPVIVVDLDGCLADLGSFDEAVAAEDGVEAQERLKADFRRSGGYRDLPPIPGAQEGMARLKEAGNKLIILTARPYQQYNRIYADTMEWLVQNGMEHDLLLFGRDKAEMICEYVYPAIPRYFVEDRAKHAMEVAELGVRVLLMATPANSTLSPNPLVTRVQTWQELTDRVVKTKTTFPKENGQ